MIVVFTGPTISATEGRELLAASFRPPASQGDIYSAARERVTAIGLIDGYFERVPAVWHKEILWALSRGVHVFGASSMGALRAAELDVFGMEGVGRVYAAYRDGGLEDDDEVAVAHGPPELEYPALSEAMVNVRATVDAAVRDSIVNPATAQELIGAAKRLHFSERTYPRILQGTESGHAEAELKAFRRWLPTGRVDQKRQDAVTMLEVLRERFAHDAAPVTAQWSFQHTIFWQRFITEIERRPTLGGAGTETLPSDAVLTELKLSDGLRYREARERALLRVLSLELAHLQGLDVSDEDVADALSQLMERLGLADEIALERWARDQRLTRAGLRHLIGDEVRDRTVRFMASRRLDMFLRDQLRLEARYGELEARSLLKQRTLASLGLENPTLRDVGVAEADLWTWFFNRLDAQVPEDLDAFARSMDFEGANDLKRGALREYAFVHRTDEANAGERPE